MSITAAELAAMRADAEALLPSACTIERATVTQDAMGGVTKSWATLASNVPCRMDEPRAGSAQASAEGELSGAVGAVAQWPMHLPHNQDVVVTDRIVFGGNTYEIAEVLDSASWLITRRLMVKRAE